MRLYRFKLIYECDSRVAYTNIIKSMCLNIARTEFQWVYLCKSEENGNMLEKVGETRMKKKLEMVSYITNLKKNQHKINDDKEFTRFYHHIN